MNEDTSLWTRARQNARRPYLGSTTMSSLAHQHLGMPDIIPHNQPLKNARNIRLLWFIPPAFAAVLRQSSRQVKVELVETCIEDAPDYYALSYTWGDESLPGSIICSGKEMRVTRNLERALTGIRNSNEAESEKSLGLFVWADGLCINQDDLEEKRSQLAMMPEIYKNATRTIVFLSELSTSERVKRALDHISDLARMERLIHDGVVERADRTHQGNSYFRGRVAHPALAIRNGYVAVAGEIFQYGRRIYKHFEEDHAQRNAPAASPGHQITKMDLLQHDIQRIDFSLLDEMFKSPWFGRSWINQEIGYAYTADFYLGKYRIRWDELRRLAIVLASQDPSSEMQFAAGFLRIAKIKESLAQGADGRLPPLLAMRLCRPCGAKDPRDKIYSLLSMMRRSGEEFGVDYKAAWQRVYEDFARDLITRERSLEILTCCDWKQDRDTNLPSWVPDWTDQDFSREPIPPGYRASGDSQPCVAFPGEGILTTKAILFDRVMEFSEVLAPPTKYSSFEDFERSRSVKERHEVQAGEAFFVEAESIAARASVEEMYPVPRDAFLRTLVCGRGIPPRSRPNEDDGKVNESTISSSWYSTHGCGLFSQQTFSEKEKLEMEPMVCEHGRMARRNCADSRVFSTHRGYIGLGPKALEANDVIAVLCGADTPFVLRERGDGRYMLLGYCYVDGIMDGQVLNLGGDLEAVSICVK